MATVQWRNAGAKCRPCQKGVQLHVLTAGSNCASASCLVGRRLGTHYTVSVSSPANFLLQCYPCLPHMPPTNLPPPYVPYEIHAHSSFDQSRLPTSNSLTQHQRQDMPHTFNPQDPRLLKHSNPSSILDLPPKPIRQSPFNPSRVLSFVSAPRLLPPNPRPDPPPRPPPDTSNYVFVVYTNCSVPPDSAPKPPPQPFEAARALQAMGLTFPSQPATPTDTPATNPISQLQQTIHNRDTNPLPPSSVPSRATSSSATMRFPTAPTYQAHPYNPVSASREQQSSTRMQAAQHHAIELREQQARMLAHGHVDENRLLQMQQMRQLQPDHRIPEQVAQPAQYATREMSTSHSSAQNMVQQIPQQIQQQMSQQMTQQMSQQMTQQMTQQMPPQISQQMSQQMQQQIPQQMPQQGPQQVTQQMAQPQPTQSMELHQESVQQQLQQQSARQEVQVQQQTVQQHLRERNMQQLQQHQRQQQQQHQQQLQQQQQLRNQQQQLQNQQNLLRNQQHQLQNQQQRQQQQHHQHQAMQQQLHQQNIQRHLQQHTAQQQYQRQQQLRQQQQQQQQLQFGSRDMQMQQMRAPIQQAAQMAGHRQVGGRGAVVDRGVMGKAVRGMNGVMCKAEASVPATPTTAATSASQAFPATPSSPDKTGSSSNGSGQREHSCTYPGCNKTFDRRYNLTVHFRRHTDEMPYPCKVEGCAQRFKWRSSQSHHMKTRHHMVKGRVEVRSGLGRGIRYPRASSVSEEGNATFSPKKRARTQRRNSTNR